MPPNQISQVMLRTSDAAGATAFYDAVLGHHGDAVYPLHENAVARGARPHWLGCVDTADPEGSAGPFLAAGGERLGPRPGGGFLLRDAGGAIIAFGPVAAPSVAGVVRCVLHTRDVDRAVSLYTRVFGWSLGAHLGGGFREFSWRAGGDPVGAISGVEQTAGVHPQWLYFFGVASFDAAVAAAYAGGATMLPTGTMPDGRRYAGGDDPQGAAFGLMER